MHVEFSPVFLFLVMVSLLPAAGRLQADDITVLAVTRLETGVESTTLLVAPELVSATG